MEVDSKGLRASRVLFLQATEPANYPPLIHASILMAQAGWEVTFLSAPVCDWPITLPSHPRVDVRSIRPRRAHVMRTFDYAAYAASSVKLALRQRPDVVYASDSLGAGPGLLVANLVGAELVYHEHDSPQPGSLNRILARFREATARSARLIVFPNAERARLAQSELEFSDDKLRIVWNVPRRAEIVSSVAAKEPPLIIYYHGSITPERLPDTVALAVRRMAGQVLLRIAGYEVAAGYVRHLLGCDHSANERTLIKYLGLLPSRADLLAEAARAHVGLSLTPFNSGDLNMSNMAGASNKPFDYMASGLALLVTDTPPWTRMFVEPGFGLACNPTNVDSLTTAFGWFIKHPEERRAMAARARRKIEKDWNYDVQFSAVLESLESIKIK